MDLLARLDEPDRFATLMAAIERGDAVSTIMDVVADLAYQHGRCRDEPTEPESRRLLTFEHLVELERLALAPSPTEQAALS
jgi:hypothetical protein